MFQIFPFSNPLKEVGLGQEGHKWHSELVTCVMGCPVQGYSREDSSRTHSGSPADKPCKSAGYWKNHSLLGRKGWGEAGFGWLPGSWDGG